MFLINLLLFGQLCSPSFSLVCAGHSPSKNFLSKKRHKEKNYLASSRTPFVSKTDTDTFELEWIHFLPPILLCCVAAAANNDGDDDDDDDDDGGGGGGGGGGGVTLESLLK